MVERISTVAVIVIATTLLLMFLHLPDFVGVVIFFIGLSFALHIAIFGVSGSAHEKVEDLDEY